MDERGFRAQEPFLIGVQNRHQPAFGNVEPFAQQVDANEDIINAEPQVADQLDPLKRLNVAVHVADTKPGLMHEFSQILSHPLGQRGDERAVSFACDLAAFVDAILHLIFGRANFDGRVNQAGGADDLFGEYALHPLHFPITRRCADIGRLRAHRIPFVETKRAVVDAAWQAKAIFGEREFAAVITPRHAVDLADADMAFINEEQRIFGEIFKQCRWRFTGEAT